MQFQWIIFVFLRKSLFKKLSAFKFIYSVWNSEEIETLIFHIASKNASKNFLREKKTDISNLIDTTFSFYSGY